MMTSLRGATARLAAAVLAVGVVTCAKKPPLEQLLADLEAAVEARDVGAVTSLLAPNFQAQDGVTAVRVPEELRRYFFAYESIDATVSEVMPTGTPPTSVSLRADLAGKPKSIGALGALLPALSAFRFELDLAPRDGRLVITSARWERLDRPAP